MVSIVRIKYMVLGDSTDCSKNTGFNKCFDVEYNGNIIARSSAVVYM